MNCGNLWMGRIMRLWSVTRSGLESWLSWKEEGQAQCGWRQLGCVLAAELGWWTGCSTPPASPFLSSTRRKLSKYVGTAFYPSPGKDSWLLLALRRGLPWVTQALLCFPAFLGFQDGQAAPGGVVAPYAAAERKFLPALVNHLRAHGRCQFLRPAEPLTLGLHLGYLCITTLHSEGHCTVHSETWLGRDSRSPAPGEASRDRGHCNATVYTITEFLTKPSEEINF